MWPIFGFVIFVLNIVGTIEVVKSSRDMVKKIIWILAMWFTFGIGTIVYYLLKLSKKR